MTYKEAREYLQPLADYTTIPRYAAALAKAADYTTIPRYAAALAKAADYTTIPRYTTALAKAAEALEEKEGPQKVYLLERYYCKACKKMHCKVVETEGYFTREEAEAAISCH